MSQSPYGELMTHISRRELTRVTLCGEGGKEWFGLVAEQQKGNVSFVQLSKLS